MIAGSRIRAALPLVGVIAAGVLALVIGWFSGDSRPLGFPLDDAWIHMVYGRNLASDGVLAYNEVATTGATSPLWAGLVALAHLLGGGDVDRTIVVVYVLGAGFFVAALVLTYRLALQLTASRVAATAAGLLVALSGPFALTTFSGMEVTLTASLVLGAVDACVRGRWTSAGIWLALGALARPEIALVSAACFGFTAATQTNGARRHALVRLTLPSLVIGTVVVLHALVATGHPLPATFYMKQEASLRELPSRLYIVIRGLLGDVPPLATGLAYLGMTGLFTRTSDTDETLGRRLLPAGCGLLLVVVSAVLIKPYANVFYHLRYVLPAVPLLVVGAVTGAHRLGRLAARRSPRLGPVPLYVLVAIGLLEALPSLPRHGRRVHNDTRNIEEVQRALGTWIAEHTDPGTWIATGDAGAVRYFGDRPTIDVMGLNTPELYWKPTWGAAHPIAAFVMIPCWFKPDDPTRLRVAAGARTEAYTVTHAPCMREQVVVTCAGDTPVELSFSGVKRFSLMCQPGRLHAKR